MWESLKQQIEENGPAQLTGADASTYIRDGSIVFVYEGHKLRIPVNSESSMRIHHIGGGTVKLTFGFIEVLGKIEAP